MAAFPGKIDLFFSVDASSDLSAGVLTLGVDNIAFPATASFVAVPPADVAAARPVVLASRTRYWWTYLCGAAQLVTLVDGTSTIYGRLAIGTNDLPLVWHVATPAS